MRKSPLPSCGSRQMNSSSPTVACETTSIIRAMRHTPYRQKELDQWEGILTLYSQPYLLKERRDIAVNRGDIGSACCVIRSTQLTCDLLKHAPIRVFAVTNGEHRYITLFPFGRF